MAMQFGENQNCSIAQQESLWCYCEKYYAFYINRTKNMKGGEGHEKSEEKPP